jgi:hypothetical protein
MDPGQVIWLPGSGFSGDDMNQACENAYGTSACDWGTWENWTVVYCC